MKFLSMNFPTDLFSGDVNLITLLFSLPGIRGGGGGGGGGFKLEIFFFIFFFLCGSDKLYCKVAIPHHFQIVLE